MRSSTLLLGIAGGFLLGYYCSQNLDLNLNELTGQKVKFKKDNNASGSYDKMEEEIKDYQKLKQLEDYLNNLKQEEN